MSENKKLYVVQRRRTWTERIVVKEEPKVVGRLTWAELMRNDDLTSLPVMDKTTELIITPLEDADGKAKGKAEPSTN